MLLNILLTILVLDCIALTGVILMQRSEGGALGMGGGPSGMFTARGAGDLLTRLTSIFTTVFFVLSLAITLLAGHTRENASLTQRMKVNPIDLSAIAAGSSSAPARAASSAPAAPPLPNAAPPLPSAAPLPSLATQAPRPTLTPQLRQAIPAPAPARAKSSGRAAATAATTNASAPPAPTIAAPAPLTVPPPPASTPAPAGQAPAPQ